MSDRFVIEREDDYETECEASHPVRLARNAQPFPNDPYFLSDRSRAIQAGRRGYLCGGGEVHFYTMWSVVDTTNGNVLNRFYTYKEAKVCRAELVAKEIPGPAPATCHQSDNVVS